MWAALEGVTVASRYELREHLATGGMASVFRGWDHRLQRPVAIKMLRELAAADKRNVERFRREAEASAALRNPHIVEVYDFLIEDGCAYLIMELIQGRNLKQRLVEGGALAPLFALDIAAQVCVALEAAHARGYIHRDIKPQNVLLDVNGLAKLADFGIVHTQGASAITTDGIVMGTADYISPEQAQGLALTPATDLYALGVVLYESLTGVLPFTATSPVAVAMLHATVPVTPPTRLDPTIPPEVERIILHALRKDPELRFRSAREMLAFIREAQARLHARLEASVATLTASPSIPLQGHEAELTPASVATPADAAPAPLDWREVARRLREPRFPEQPDPTCDLDALEIDEPEEQLAPARADARRGQAPWRLLTAILAILLLIVTIALLRLAL